MKFLTKFLSSTCFLFVLTATMEAQVTIGSGNNPSNASLLDLKTQESPEGGVTSTTGGLLLPRVELKEINSLLPFIAGGGTDIDKTSNKGLLVYNLTETTPFQIGLYAWNGVKWVTYTQNDGVNFTANNGLTLSNSNVKLGGTLTENTKISGTNSLTLAIPTSVSNNLTVTGNETVSGTLGVSGATSLNATNIDISTSDKTLVINDGKSSKAGKYLKAMDDTGKAEWQDLGSLSTSSPVVFGTGLTYDPSKNEKYMSTGTKIKLPSGKWMVQCALLFEVSSPSNTSNNSHWVQCQMKTTSGPSIVYAGSSMVSGNISKKTMYNMVSGYFIVSNTTSNTQEYEFTVSASTYAYQGGVWTAGDMVTCFASSFSENAIVAFALSE